jgi:hypothetical protein
LRIDDRRLKRVFLTQEDTESAEKRERQKRVEKEENEIDGED